MKSTIEILCDKIDDELEDAPVSKTITSLASALSPEAVSQLILNISDLANHDFDYTDYHSEFIYAISKTLKESNQSTLKDIINKLDEDIINTLNRLLKMRKKAIILSSFIKIRNNIIKRNKLKGKEFKLYNIEEDKLDTICNIYVYNLNYNTPETIWQSLDSLTTGPIYIIKQQTFGRTGKFKEVFDNIEDIIKRNKER